MEKLTSFSRSYAALSGLGCHTRFPASERHFIKLNGCMKREMGGFLRERLQLKLNLLDPQRTFISSLGSASGNGDGTVCMYVKHLGPGGSLSAGELLAHDYFLN